MSTQSLQALLVAVIVSISALVAARHLAPKPFRLLQSRLARALGGSRRNALLRLIGRWLQPLEAKQGGCGSGLGCASCGGCGTTNSTPVESIPLRFPPPLQRH